jgi:hypothetical protein
VCGAPTEHPRVAPLLPCWYAPPAPLPPLVFLFHTAPYTTLPQRSLHPCVLLECVGAGGWWCVWGAHGAPTCGTSSPLLAVSASPTCTPAPRGVPLPHRPPTSPTSHTLHLHVCGQGMRRPGGRGRVCGAHTEHPRGTSSPLLAVSACPTCTPAPRRVPLKRRPPTPPTSHTLHVHVCGQGVAGPGGPGGAARAGCV